MCGRWSPDWKLGPKGRRAFDFYTGINLAADPEIGGGYTMATEHDMPGFKAKGPKTWNFQWAGVVMKDGDNNITLENYAVSYGIQDLAGYAIKFKVADGSWKRVRKVAFVKLEDGIFIELQNRPDDEMKMLNGCRVIATGKLIMAADAPPNPTWQDPIPCRHWSKSIRFNPCMIREDGVRIGDKVMDKASILQWIVGIVIALIAAGGGVVAWLVLFHKRKRNVTWTSLQSEFCKI